MSARARIFVLALAPLGCFSPTKVDGQDSGSTSAADTSTSSTLDTTASTSPPTTTMPADSSGPEETGCVHECDAEGASCNGDMLEQCTVDGGGCRRHEAQACAYGCADSACLRGDPAELAISIVSASWAATELQVTYVVANLGAEDSGDFRVDLWPDRPLGFGGPPAVSEIGTLGVAKTSLGPGDAMQYTDAIPMAPNGRHVAFAVVDTEQLIAELDENNNVSLGFAWTNTVNEVHTSFGAPSAPLAIPDDGTPLESMITVELGVTQPQIWFSVNITHPEVSDLQIEIISPKGLLRSLSSAIPPGANLGGTTFRDGAAVTLVEVGAPFVGEFEPETPFPTPPQPQGSWTIRVTDSVPGNSGQVNDWSLSFYEVDP